jgi:hypothetical protein
MTIGYLDRGDIPIGPAPVGIPVTVPSGASRPRTPSVISPAQKYRAEAKAASGY